MTTSKITIQKITEEDGLLEIRFSAENSQHKTTVENYLDIENLTRFCQELQTFPFSQSEVVFSAGKDEIKSHSFLFLRAYLYDSLGHASLEIKTRTNGATYVAAESHFTIITEVASINALASALHDWLLSNERYFEFMLFSGLH